VQFIVVLYHNLNCISDLAVECFEKGRRNRPLLPLQSLKDFELIYDGGAGKAASGGSPTRSTPQNTRGSTDRNQSNQSPVRRTRSISPLKEVASTRKPAATSSTTAVPRATSTSSEQSSPTGTKKSAKSPAEMGSDDVEAAGDAKQSKQSKATIENIKNNASSEDNDKSKQITEESVVERKIQSKVGPTVARSGNKPLPYLARPGVAKQSTSNTMREVQSRKKKVLAEDNDYALDNSEDNTPNRGS